MSTIKEFFKFLIERKKYWLVPFYIVIFVLAILIVLLPGSQVAPFIYSIF